MALNFRYNGVGNTKAWTKADWSTYDKLVWASLAVHIGSLNEESAEEFCRRANALRLFVKDGAPRDISPVEIEKFYGLETNVSTLTGSKWAALVMSGRDQANSEWIRRVHVAADKLAKNPAAIARNTAAAKRELEAATK